MSENKQTILEQFGITEHDSKTTMIEKVKRGAQGKLSEEGLARVIALIESFDDEKPNSTEKTCAPPPQAQPSQPKTTNQNVSFKENSLRIIRDLNQKDQWKFVLVLISAVLLYIIYSLNNDFTQYRTDWYLDERKTILYILMICGFASLVVWYVEKKEYTHRLKLLSRGCLCVQGVTSIFLALLYLANNGDSLSVGLTLFLSMGYPIIGVSALYIIISMFIHKDYRVLKEVEIKKPKIDTETPLNLSSQGEDRPDDEQIRELLSAINQEEGQPHD